MPYPLLREIITLFGRGYELIFIESARYNGSQPQAGKSGRTAKDIILTAQPPYARVHFSPAADPRAVVTTGKARFSILTPCLLRMEYSPDGHFEDRPSQVFWHRQQAVPAFGVERTRSGAVKVTTERLRLEYAGNDAPFGHDSLVVTLLDDGTAWQFGDHDAGNLLGTTRTLDKVSGSTRLEPGLLSRDGWVVIDDSRTLVFDETGWLVTRGNRDACDLYFFGHGRDYRGALRDYRAVSGGVPLLPRWSLGNWWSRYWPYSDAELRALMTDFRDHDVPLSVCIVDMDWHLVNVGEGINGWTGYTWNLELFPDPPAFIDWLHGQGLRTALNLHPALGVRPYEAMYPEMARRMGLDPAEGKPVPFDIADPRFTAAYFEILHHPQEADGVDFWWMDWQQGQRTSMAGLDPLWWLNHLHFYDLGRDGKRPFVFSRWGGLGNHRYPIGFSGDTVVSWESLAFQPYFTATAANVGYGWWSHDIGGHMQGIEDRELYTRWVQFGVFSPIFRLHSTQNPFHERRPWGYDAEVERVTRDVMQLRHALIPYLYTMSHLNESEGLAPVRPMYHEYPERDEAYACPQQYLFGTDLLVAPYAAAADPDTRLSRQVVWLPPGDWYHFFSGEYHLGDNWYARHGNLEDIPVYARAGAIVPLGPQTGWGGIENPETMHLRVFAGADGRFALYEDDGESTAYQAGASAVTRIEQRMDGDRLHLTISSASGDHSVLPAQRTWHLHFFGLSVADSVVAMIDGVARPLDFEYDAAREILNIEPLPLDALAQCRITVSTGSGRPLLSRRDRTLETAYRLIKSFRMDTLAKAWIVPRLEAIAARPEELADFGIDMTPSQIRALLEVTQGVGVQYLSGLAEENLVVLWNNRAAPGFRHYFAQLNPEKWFADERFGSSFGTTPRFLTIVPEGESWRLAVDYFGLQNFSLPRRFGAD